jgi:ParB-like nuclease domain
VGVVVKTVEIDLIDMSTRLRPVDEAAVPALANSLDKEGLLQAIGLRRGGQMGARYTLIWGAHRLAAARSLGWTWLSAKVYAAKDLPEGVSAVELEALENLSRSELSPYDRAMTIAGLLKAMREAAGLTEGQDGRAYNAANFEPETAFDSGDAPISTNFVDLVAERIGVGFRTIEDALKLARNLRPDTAAAMRPRDGWKIASIVQACASLKDRLIDPRDPEKGKMPHGSGQDALIAWLDANPKGSLKEALSALEVEPAEISPSQKAANAVNNSWRKIRPSERVAVLGQLIDGLTPGQRKELLVVLDATWQADALAAVGGDDQ